VFYWSIPQILCKPELNIYWVLIYRTCISWVSVALRYCSDGMRLCFCGTGILTGPLSIPHMIYEWIWSSGGMILIRENRRTRRKSYPSATLSTINPILTELGAESGLRDEKPATNRLSYMARPPVYALSFLGFVFSFCILIL
jgi:hypothetical protein